MKSMIAVLAASLAATALPVHAEEASPLTFNIGATSDYRYRGISQSRLKPALQGGVDYAHASGFYIGSWASTIKWIKDVPGGDASVEIDVYGGYKTEVAQGLTLDVGALTYIYPSNKLSPNANTTELYAALSYGPVTAKYSHALTNTFGNVDSKNSGYLDVSASFEIVDGWTLAPHVGHQWIKGPARSAASYTDYSLALSKDFKGLVPSLSVVSTNADKDFYVPGANANSTKFLGKTGVVVALKYNF
ncbi:TorF family putative porin [Pelomonas sp. CA6]|uniref:TorF family putative porin n=1 Tax=Pelomonas sp. CA6 TaxID=2907999 RepID=UPI001F4B4C46|nr:TorF family putative porin [Pelomonas sp. CA6]MCH7342489.1 TorF family putative porin [Pelomonas sp. CA6]